MDLRNDISADELKVFIEESEEQIQLLDENIIRMENESDNIDLIQEIFRAAHTLKGSSAMIGHKNMAEVTHAMENLLDKLRNKKLKINAEIVDVLLAALDYLKVLKKEISDNKETNLDITPIIAQLKVISNIEDERILDGSTNKNYTDQHEYKSEQEEIIIEKIVNSKNAADKTYIVETIIKKTSDWKAVRCLQILAEIKSIGTLVISKPDSEEIENQQIDDRLLLIINSQNQVTDIKTRITAIDEIEQVKVIKYDIDTWRNKRHGAAKNLKDTRNPDNRLTNNRIDPQEDNKKDIFESILNEKAELTTRVKVDVNVLDKLMNMVEELVIDRSRINELSRLIAKKYQDDGTVIELRQTSNHIVKLVNELYQDIMKVRMVPLSILFNKFPRLVRDLSQKQEKSVDFVIEGESTELDRNIIEQMRDPLIHLIRNAVDHGIESSKEREMASKADRALIKLSAKQEEGHVIITLKDDGRGIDPEKIKLAAIKRQLIPLNSASKLSNTEALDLIFMPGLSTANKTTEISGRGVGMDIVRTNIEKINGLISIDTEINKGTTFIIKLPLTVAIFRGLMISIDQSILIIPLVSIIETMKIKHDEIVTISGQEVMMLRNTVVPIFRLGSILGYYMDSQTDKEAYVVIVKAGELTAGILVEKLLEQQEFVVKSIGSYFGDLKGIAGATILGDGQTALILDIPTLLKMIANDSYKNKLMAVA